ncbi:MAG: 23S rRNA (pseudouridine(1915)-N(3))-methyltransferase RlmH [Candidatus Cloacimonadota bacterium]|nr:23S rRNA (pseudouridine(1915)-N(3))-methyltransferase RlmH [Candidatus Cloacimonadota bacterium]
MSIKIIALGKTKEGYLKKGITEYKKRMGAFLNTKLIVLPDVKLTKTNTIEIVKKKESEIILAKLKNRDFIIALDETGTEYSSMKFSKLLSQKIGLGDIIFIIGGVYGLDKSILKLANISLSLSQMTFTHQMIRLILFEQIYRAFTIMRGKKYHY